MQWIEIESLPLIGMQRPTRFPQLHLTRETVGWSRIGRWEMKFHAILKILGNIFGFPYNYSNCYFLCMIGLHPKA